MAQFDAGSIIATMDVDRDPFNAGLDLAKRDAEDFENNNYRIKLGVDDAEAQRKLDDIEASGDEASGDETIKISVEDEKAKVELDILKAKLDLLKDKTVTIKTKSDSKDGDIGGFQKTVNSLAEHDLPGLMQAALALSPALIPLGAVGGAGALALAGGISQAAIALGPFALVAKSAFSQMQTDTTNLATAQKNLESASTTAEKAKALVALAAAQQALVGPIGKAATAYANLNSVYKGVIKATEPAVFAPMISAFNLAAKLLPAFAPLIEDSAQAVSGAVGQLSKAFGDGSGLSSFLGFVGGNVGPALTAITTGLIGFGKGFANIIEAINPITQDLLKDFSDLGTGFGAWGTMLNNGGIQGFLTYITQNGPLVAHLFETLGSDVGLLVKALAPLAGPLLSDIITLLQGLGAGLKFLTPIMAWGSMPKILAGIVLGLLGIVGAAKAFLVVEKFGTALLKIAGILKTLGIAFGIFDADIEGTAIALAILDAIPIVALFVAIGVAVAALVVGVVELIKHWSTVEGFFRDMWNHVYSFFHTTIGQIILAFIPFIGIPLVIAEHWNTIIGFFENLWNTVYGFFKKYGAYILLAVAPVIGLPLVIYQHWNQIIGWLSGVWSHVWTDASHWWGNIIGFFEGIPSKIQSVFDTAVNWLYGVGQNIINGLINGIKSGAGKLSSTATSLAKDAIESPFKKALSIFSPSQVMAGHGLNVSLGIAQGILAGVPGVKSAMSAIADEISNTNLSPTPMQIRSMAQLSGQAALENASAQAQAQANNFLGELQKLTAVAQNIPNATGQAVGANVGNVEKAVATQTKTLVTVARSN